MKKYLFILIIASAACNRSVSDSGNTALGRPAAGINDSNQTAETDTGEMVFFKGGNITIGLNGGMPCESPSFEAVVKPFYMDKNLVTVAQFRGFISKTKFKTDAEKFGDAGVFDMNLQQWQLVKGATWEYPQGPGKPKAEDSHPVTQVSWCDADAYAKWAGKRLPSEVEWEYAAKNSQSMGYIYPWGNDERPDGQYKANVWEGDLFSPQGRDGFTLTSPVGHYGDHPCGLTDMSGNVWQWCADVYKPYPGSSERIIPNPDVRVIRGGAFTFDQAGAKSYTTTFRAKNTVETSLFNTGFRCAKDADR